ncbi:MAG: (d)CMP kinase [Bacteroidales bacterium]
MKKIIVAIDGYSASGKSVMAKKLALADDYIYIDSGAMYRAVTLYAIRQGCFSGKKIDNKKLRALLPDIRIGFRRNRTTGGSNTYLNGENVEKEIRGMDVSERVSPIAALPFVRKNLIAQQQAMGKKKGIVMEGRDIGTAVFPNAELKVFVTATLEVRAQRRTAQLNAQGEPVRYEEVLQNLQKRDHIDSTRKDSPLRQAPDALLLDNTNMTEREQTVWLLTQYLRVVRSGWK